MKKQLLRNRNLTILSVILLSISGGGFIVVFISWFNVALGNVVSTMFPFFLQLAIFTFPKNTGKFLILFISMIDIVCAIGVFKKIKTFTKIAILRSFLGIIFGLFEFIYPIVLMGEEAISLGWNPWSRECIFYMIFYGVIYTLLLLSSSRWNEDKEDMERRSGS